MQSFIVQQVHGVGHAFEQDDIALEEGPYWAHENHTAGINLKTVWQSLFMGSSGRGIMMHFKKAAKYKRFTDDCIHPYSIA